MLDVGKRGFLGQLPEPLRPTVRSIAGISSSAKANSLRTAAASKPIIGPDPSPRASAANMSVIAAMEADRMASSRCSSAFEPYMPLAIPTQVSTVA